MSLSIILRKSEHVGDLKNFAIQLGGQGGRGEECSNKGGTVSTFKLVCVLLSMLGGGTATIFSTCACVNDWRWHSHNLHLEPWVCVLMSMHGGGIATISTLKLCVFAHVNAWWWRNGRTFLAIKERHSSIIIQMSSKSTD